MTQQYHGAIESHQGLRFERTRSKSLILAYVLWFLAGLTGAHRYYLDNVKTGLAQSCMLIFSVVTAASSIGTASLFSSFGGYVFIALCIWVLLDAIMIPFIAN